MHACRASAQFGDTNLQKIQGSAKSTSGKGVGLGYELRTKARWGGPARGCKGVCLGLQGIYYKFIKYRAHRLNWQRSVFDAHLHCPLLFVQGLFKYEA